MLEHQRGQTGVFGSTFGQYFPGGRGIVDVAGVVG